VRGSVNGDRGDVGRRIVIAKEVPIGAGIISAVNVGAGGDVKRTGARGINAQVRQTRTYRQIAVHRGKSLAIVGRSANAFRVARNRIEDML